MKYSPLQAIRKNCIDCSGGSYSEVQNCNIPTCPLFEFRFGKNPSRRGLGNSSNFDSNAKTPPPNKRFPKEN